MSLLVIGASPLNDKKAHAGGQLTLTLGLLAYLRDQNINYRVIDTYVSQFPRIGCFSRVKKALFDLLKLFRELVQFRPIGIIIFSGGGLGFYEKSLYCLICRAFRVENSLIIVDGFFITSNAKKKYAIFTRLLLLFPNFIVAQGFSWKKFYKEKFGIDKKVHIIHNWFKIDDSVLSRLGSVKQDPDNIIVFFCGWLVKEKGVLELTQVAQQFQTSHKNVRFVFAGGGDLYDYCINQQNNGKLKNSNFLGWVETSDLDALYRKADIFVLPSYAEGFPNVLLEAMSFSLPIVASNVGAISDSVIDYVNGFCIKPKSIDSLLKALTILVENDTLRAKYGDESFRILQQNHDSEKCCKKLIELFI